MSIISRKPAFFACLLRLVFTSDGVGVGVVVRSVGLNVSDSISVASAPLTSTQGPGYSTNIWVQGSRWGCESLTLFRTKKSWHTFLGLILYFSLFRTKDKMHVVFFLSLLAITLWQIHVSSHCFCILGPGTWSINKFHQASHFNRFTPI